MKIALISPIRGLEKWVGLSTIHLVLAQIEDQRYVDFYKKRRARGDLLILDNGAYEKQLVSYSQLREMTDEYNPQVVVLPDNPLGDAGANLNLSTNYLYKNGDTRREFMFVPQTKNGDMLSWLYTIRVAVDELFCTWIGLPREMYRDLQLTEGVNTRSCAAALLRHRFPLVKIHALGQFGPHPIEEIQRLRQADIYSIDTSGPIWRGWRGIRYGQYRDDIPLDFNAPECDERAEAFIRANLRDIGFLDWSDNVRKEVLYP